MTDDLYFTEAGDLAVSSHGDLALTPNTLRDTGQQAYIRLKTAVGDYLMYPELGANLEELYGMPQSESTADYGISIIEQTLKNDVVFAGKNIQVEAAPTGPQSIRFDVYIVTRVQANILFSIEQSLIPDES